MNTYSLVTCSFTSHLHSQPNFWSRLSSKFRGCFSRCTSFWGRYIPAVYLRAWFFYTSFLWIWGSYQNVMQLTESYLQVTNYLHQVKLQLKHWLLLDVVDTSSLIRRLAIQHFVTIPSPEKCWHFWKWSSLWMLMYSKTESGCSSTWVVEGGGGWEL